ncbi:MULTISPECIES: glycosyltransferase family 2 protein [unclassified Cellulophaga]|uniref:glycosyltransferase family 2 protein n=1 Tax=unclassified Cellulophaga TaxID=2634405 RepID=UPI0026E46061|nr:MULTISPECIES: glycosyltransferase family 2 protein [unclassified Cellulophaga]MDO6491588.1 glycosyltransferase family 2 protein [Cellulophaga sp. 2_MG-2023]MDO6493465.1 glycosyltransferase family 2 protein [Cellulophaga sp. 3_MG-2023]
MPTPLVSILIPFKNVEAFLDECINSIISQTYTNWEILAINDHSTDSSASILENYAKKDSRIKTTLNNGQGIIKALQLAYKLSNGTYITRMDSDDIMLPNKIEIMLSSLLKNGTKHIAVGKVKYFAKNGVNDGYKKYEEWLNQLTTTGDNYSEIYKECVIPSPCWMVHKSDFDAVGGFEPNTYPEDYDLAFRFYKHKIECIPCNTILHKWRDYSTRTSRTSEHYAQNYFLELKLNYFLEIEYLQTNTLVIWGAGKKGKEIAKKLIEKNIPFLWVCNNQQKIGKDIYNQKLKHFLAINNVKDLQIIITVANQKEQLTIKSHLNTLNLKAVKDYFFFC